MKKAIVASFFVLLFGVSQARADGQLSFFAGYLHPGELNLDNIRQGLGLRETALYGARFELDFLKVLGMEQNFGFSPRLFENNLFPQEVSDLRGFLYSTNLMVNIPISHHFVPYATGGIGFVKPWGSGLKTFDATFAGTYGGGLKLNRLVGPVGLRFDARGWKTADVVNRGSVNLFEVTGEVTFTW